MNRSPRVLMIGRHFWPHGSIDSAGFLFQLACAMHRCNADVEVVTPRFASSWPTEAMIREIVVHRPAAAPRSDWSMGRYVRHLTAWLREHGGDFDLIYVDAIREEAMAAIEASKSVGCRTMVRSSGWGAGSDPVWWRGSRSARKCAAAGKMADAVIAAGGASQRALIADGFAPSRVHRIENGFQAGAVPTAASRRSARLALGRANGDLLVEDDSPVVLCCTRMTRESGVILLVKAARHLISRYPDLRLWLVGDGPYRDWIYETLRGDGVRASIAMPGSFSDSEELFAAADIFLQPDADGLDYFLPSAISMALPVVVIDEESTREVICGGSTSEPAGEDDPGQLVCWIDEPTPKMTRVAISDVLDDLTRHRDNAGLLRRRMLRVRPQSATVSAHLALTESLIDRAGGGDRKPSVEAVS